MDARNQWTAAFIWHTASSLTCAASGDFVNAAIEVARAQVCGSGALLGRSLLDLEAVELLWERLDAREQVSSVRCS